MSRLSLVLLLSMLLFNLVSGNAWADSYNTGVNAYNRGDYATAVGALKQAVESDPGNPRKVFYYGLTLAQLKQYQAARTAFEKVGQLLPATHELAVKARKNVAVITQAQMSDGGNPDKAKQVAQKTLSSSSSRINYLSYAISKGKVIHWDTQKMPIKVFISEGKEVPGWTYEMKEMVLQAMSTWQAASRSKIRFSETHQLNRADIVVRWQRTFPHNKVGENPFEAVNGTIIRSDVKIALYSGMNGVALPRAVLQRTILHELGHALGIQGHSPYSEDVMYFSVNDSQSGTLTSRDKNTLALLYQMDADIKNKGALSTTQTRQYYETMNKAVNNQVRNNPSQAIVQYSKAIQLNPTDPDLYYNLAGAFADKGDKANAILSYRKAIALNSGRMDARYNLGILLVNQGVQFAQRNQRETARQYFTEAVQMFSVALRGSNPPQSTAKNLEVARKNLQALDG